MGETLTIRTSSSTDVIKVVERGPQGPTGPAGEAGGVERVTVESYSTNSNAPESLTLSSYISNNALRVLVLAYAGDGANYTELILPDMGTGYGEVTVRALLFEDGSQNFIKLRLAGQEATPIWPAGAGYDEPDIDLDYVFRWIGDRWDLDILVSDLETTAKQIFKPRHDGTLAAFGGSAPSTPTSSGTPGELRWGYASGSDRLYLCVAANTWRRIPISSW